MIQLKSHHQERVDSSLKPRLSSSKSIAPCTTTWWKFEVKGERFVTSAWFFKIVFSPEQRGQWAQPPVWAYPVPASPCCSAQLEAASSPGAVVGAEPPWEGQKSPEMPGLSHFFSSLPLAFCGAEPIISQAVKPRE